MRFKCRDCGSPLPDKLERSHSDDVCDLCWDARMRVVTGAMPLSTDEFYILQRKIAAGCGAAAAYIKERDSE